MMSPRIAVAWIGYALAAIFLALFLVLPLSVALGAAFLDAHWQPTGVFLREALLHPVYRQAIVNSAEIAAVTTALCIVIALPLAWIGARYRFRGQGLAEGLLLAPLVLPPFVGAIGVFQIFGRFGVLNAVLAHIGLQTPGTGPDWLGEHRFALVCLVEALGLFPFLYLNLAATLANFDASLVEAAASLGASKLVRLRRVVLPLLRPGLFAGCAVIFVWSFTELGTPLMLGYQRALPVQIFVGLNEVNANHLPYAQVVVMLVVSAGLYLAARLALARSAAAAAGKGAVSTPPVPLTGGGAVAAWAAFACAFVPAVLPHMAVATMALAHDWYGTVLPASWTTDHFQAALSHELVVPAIANSLRYAGGATALALIIGTFVAWTSARWRPRGWRLLDIAAMVPLAVPGIIIAFGYLAMTASVRWLGWLDPTKHDPTLLLIVAYGVRRLPHVVRSAAAGFDQVPIALEEAAASLGAGPAYRLRRVVLPLMAGFLAAGAIMTFSASMLEVSDSLVLAQKRGSFPITRVIYDLVSELGHGPAVACAFATWAMLFLAASLAAASVLRRGAGLSQSAR